jgi:hypothetical protein
MERVNTRGRERRKIDEGERVQELKCMLHPLVNPNLSHMCHTCSLSYFVEFQFLALSCFS